MRRLPLVDYKDFRQSLKEIESQNEGKGFLYKLYAENAGVPVSVNRVAGVDNIGILYIGQTTNLVSRLSLLFRSFRVEPKKGIIWRHGAEEIYWQCNAVREKYRSDNMFVEIVPCENSKESEFKTIKEYYLKFGEVPPFNGAIVKSRKWDIPLSTSC